MFQKIIEITLPIFLIAWLGYAYSRRFRPDLGGANKLIVDLALPILIFSSLASKSFEPLSAATFTLASVVTFRHKGASCFRHIGASSKRSN